MFPSPRSSSSAAITPILGERPLMDWRGLGLNRPPRPAILALRPRIMPSSSSRRWALCMVAMLRFGLRKISPSIPTASSRFELARPASMGLRFPPLSKTSSQPIAAPEAFWINRCWASTPMEKTWLSMTTLATPRASPQAAVRSAS